LSADTLINGTTDSGAASDMARPRLTRDDPAEIAQHFCFEGSFQGAIPHGKGHINDTYIVRCEKGDRALRPYILQRINHRIFKDPIRLMENIERVTSHLRRTIAAAGGDPQRETLNLILTREGAIYHRTSGGDYWRAYHFIAGAQTFDIAPSPQHIYHASRAFGRFQRLVSDLPPGQLHETIPDFHHTPKRFQALVEAVQRDTCNRASSARAEIAFAEKRSKETGILLDLLAQGRLPRRVTHNDTKFNNVLIDDLTGEGVCVIDLDTVMPGLSLYDFGDSVRSGANPAAEDERDLSKVTVDVQTFDRFVSGYLDAVRDLLTPIEVDLLTFSARIMTLECGIRFLTDYLSGDVYFKTRRESQNLDRSRTQFKMVQDMEDKADLLTRVVDRYR